MTEDEAKTKWCPEMLPHKVADPTANWGWDGKCLGSACVAWRWAAFTMWTCEPTHSEAAANVANAGKSGGPYVGGYCGLAGKP